jgi:type IV secretory pathway ATPase VirB11/archaellum biosynthesis ATPase
MEFDVEAYFKHSLDGHCAMTKIHADSHHASYRRMVGILEREKRGVRFLPAQVINRAVRKLMRPSKAKIKESM